jgi:hypothetical protein
MSRFLSAAAVIACFAIQHVLALPTVSVKGAKFFADGQEFYLKGK